jgi:hypothetical protein
MNEFERRPASDAGARLQGCGLALVAWVLMGIGFWQHYENYLDAEQDRRSMADEQTTPEGDGSSLSVMGPGTAGTREHAKLRVQVSDISWRDCRYR